MKPLFPARRPVRTLASLAFRLAGSWWRSILPLAASCGVIAAVVGAAFGVGDAIGTGLAKRVDDQLGGILATADADRPFNAEIATRFGRETLPDGVDRIEPAIVVPLSVERPSGGGAITRANLLAVADPRSLGWPDAPPPLPPDTVAVNRALAETLRLSVGDELVLRMPDRSEIPSESPLGRRVVATRGRRVAVGAILGDRGIGSFSLTPAGQDAPLALSSLATARSLMRREDAATNLVAIGPRPGGDASRRAAAALAAGLRPTLADYGLAFEAIRPGIARLSSSSLLIPPEADRAVETLLEPLGGTATMLLLANTIAVASDDEPEAAEAMVPYSTIAGVAGNDLPFGRLLGADGAALAEPREGRIVIDQWLADDLSRQRGSPVGIGSSLIVKWFAPETLHGRIEERTRRFIVSGIARMEEAAVERSVVPEVEGITDKRSIANWDPPFPFDATRVRTTPPNDQDDRYWKEHAATPKAFVSLAEARAMAGARFGRSTAWHVPVSDPEAVRTIAARLAGTIDPRAMGFRFRAVRQEAEAAAAGSTPFASLFLALSSFVVVSGFALEWLLSRLLVETRRKEIGGLSAIGWRPPRIAALFGGIGAIAAFVGCILGAAVGPMGSSLLLRFLSRGLHGIEVPAGGGVFGASAFRPTTVAAVAVGTFLTAAVAPWLAAFMASRDGARRLLAGSGRRSPLRRSSRWKWLGLASAAAVIAAALLALTARPDAEEAGTFFLAGSLALVGLLGLVRLVLVPADVRSTWGLVRRGLVHEPGRTLAVVAVVAVAEFLIVAVSAFAVTAPEDPQDRKSATGGWTLIATLAEPCGIDLHDRSQLSALGLLEGPQEAVLEAGIDCLRVSDGDDASCLNLFRAGNPTLLGVGREFRGRDAFRFTASIASAGESPWELLDRPGPTPEAVPVILDDATARYALGLSGLGARFEVANGTGATQVLEVVGLLAPGILQGYLVVAEEHFLKMFPRSAGYSMVLARMRPGEESTTATALSRALADFGPTIVPSVDRLRSLGVVQNTYLAGFQLLGTLGLLLGTAGLAASQVRGVLERAPEFGLLAAIGFTPGRVGRLIAAESVLEVALGLMIGAAAATLAVWPQFAAGRAAWPAGWAVASSFGTLFAAAIMSLVVARSAANGRPFEVMRSP